MYHGVATHLVNFPNTCIISAVGLSLISFPLLDTLTQTTITTTEISKLLDPWSLLNLMEKALFFSLTFLITKGECFDPNNCYIQKHRFIKFRGFVLWFYRMLSTCSMTFLMINSFPRPKKLMTSTASKSPTHMRSKRPWTISAELRL